MRGDTIAAIATAPGRGGVAVIRVSGPEAFLIGERLTRRPPQPGRIAFAKFYSPTPSTSQLPNTSTPQLLDSGLYLSFKAPHSYTGEDVIELQCHGGSVTPRRVLEACFAAGARLARRGEFTERAFLNGKLDFEAAEAVLNLIDAKTDRAADDALGGFEGKRKKEVRVLYDQVLELSSTVEHSLDIDEGELPENFYHHLHASLITYRSSLHAAIVDARAGKMRRDGALVVLAGPPNAGKSSLMNALLGENRAIVSAVPGTTRDSIEEWLDLGGWPVRLVDTAGLRASNDEIEAEGIKRAEDLIEKADVVLRLQPANEEFGTLRTWEGWKADNEIFICSKSDLNSPTTHLSNAPTPQLPVSSLTGDGLDALRAALVAKFEAKANEFTDASDDADRTVSVLLEVESLLTQTLTTFNSNTLPPDLVLFGNELRQVCEKLGSLLGTTYSDDLLEALFSRFCVGK